MLQNIKSIEYQLLYTFPKKWGEKKITEIHWRNAESREVYLKSEGKESIF